MKGVLQRSMARMIGKTTRVSAVSSPTPNLLRVRLEGRDLRGLSLRPGDKIKAHVGDGEMRSYTPSAVDPARGEMELLVHAHGDSAGSRWARALAPGHEVAFVGPSGSLDGRVAEGTAWIAFYGDETAVGLAEVILDALPPGTLVLGAVELAAADLGAVDALPVDAVERGGARGSALVRHLESLDVPAGEGTVFLSGEASSVLSLREALLTRGFSRQQLRIKPYWSVRGKAHRKRLEKTVFES